MITYDYLYLQCRGFWMNFNWVGSVVYITGSTNEWHLNTRHNIAKFRYLWQTQFTVEPYWMLVSDEVTVSGLCILCCIYCTGIYC
jgi:hypothetical protein